MCSITLTFWTIADQNSVTGDEPHYLVISHGIIKYGSLEQTRPYLDEFKSRKIFKRGLAPKNAYPNPQNTHALKTKNGLYSFHNIGLPLLLAIPYGIGGKLGAKFFLVLLGLFIIYLCWFISKEFTEKWNFRLLSIVTLVFAMPFIPAQSQIYPDLVSGILSLGVIIWIFYKFNHNYQHNLLDPLIILLIAFLPWLHIKYLSTACVLLCALVIVYYKTNNFNIKIIIFLLVPFLSLFLLGYYNYYAFGHIWGPYKGDGIIFNKHAFMVLMGLHFDQFQGLYLQNPAFLLGLLFVVPFLKRHTFIGVLVLTIYGSLVVPNALHPNWYGGGSFGGRFIWSGATVFLPIGVFGIIKILEEFKKLSYYVVGLLGIIQLFHYVRYSFLYFPLYNNKPQTWFFEYVSFYSPLKYFLPALYDSRWAYAYLPNYIFLFFAISLLIIGALYRENNILKIKKVLVLNMAVFFVIFMIAGIINSQKFHPIKYQGNQLHTKIGFIDGHAMVAKEHKSKEGFLVRGPIFRLPKAKYRFSIEYSGNFKNKKQKKFLGYWKAFSSQGLLFKVDLPPSYKRKIITKVCTFGDKLHNRYFKFRTYYNGKGTLKVHSLSFEIAK